MGDKMSRILVIGLDGATFDLIKPFVREGNLPHLKRLIEDGTSAILESTPFPHSAPAWTSCITGVNPGKHGVFGFGVRDSSNSYRFQLPNSTSVGAKTLPLLLTEYGKRSILINEPLSFPPYRINGFIISGLLTPGGKTFTYPAELQEELLSAVPDYVTEVSPFDFDLGFSEGKSAYAEALYASIRARTKAAKLFMEREKWDFFMVVFTELDRIQHRFWAEMERSHLFHQEKDASLNPMIFKTYQELDKSVQTLVDGLKEGTFVFIVSDHGFGPLEKVFYANKFLEEGAFLKLKTKGFSDILGVLKRIATRIPGAKMAYEHLHGLKQSKRKKFVENIDPRHYQQKIERWVVEEMVDWSKTRAFTDQYGIRINMKDREPKGIVTPGKEADLLIEELKRQLLELKFPHNGRPVFTDMKGGKQVYHGPFAANAPDLVTFMDVGNPHPAYHAKSLFGDSRATTGAHRKDGIFIAWGPGIRENHPLGRANIVDIAPTACYTLEIPLTSEMDGVVLEIFKEGLDIHRLSRVRGTSMVKKGEQVTYTPDQESEIKRQLKGLGYLD
jgi:predicted AlkP superfamily phosphohydrolase/phosphomutase